MEQEPNPVDETILYFLKEPTLWPVLLVVLFSVGAFLGTVLLVAIQQRGLFAIVAICALVLGSLFALDRDIRARTLSPSSILVLGLWAASGLTAGGMVWIGLY